MIRTILFVGLLCVTGTLVRCAHPEGVFRDGEVGLVPADSHYYVRYAELLRESFPRFVNVDPLLASGRGAEVNAPALHALGVAGVIALFPEVNPERVAAFIGPLFSLIWLLLLAVFSLRVLDGTASIVASGVLALTPAAVESGALGNADHHVHEGALAFAIALAVGVLCERATHSRAKAADLSEPQTSSRASGRSTPPAILTGLLLGSAGLFTRSGFAFIPPAFAALALTALAHPVHASALRRHILLVTGVAAGVLTLVSGIFGDLSSLEYSSATAFQPLLSLASGATAFAICAARAKDHRAAWTAGLVSLLAGAPLIFEASTALAHLGREDAILSVVSESLPLITHPRLALTLLGITLPLTVVSLVYLRRLPPMATGASVLTGSLLVAAAFQLRFAQPLVGAAAVLIALAFSQLFRKPRAFRAATVAALPALLILPIALTPPAPFPEANSLRPVGAWLREHVPPSGEAIAANPLLGHLLLLWAERPVVGSGFSQMSEHVEANARAQALFAAETESELAGLASEAGAKWLVVTEGAFPTNAPGARGLLVPRTDAGRRILSAQQFRLAKDFTNEHRYLYVYERVAGALLTGTTSPNAEVQASLWLADELDYRTTTRADAHGNFALRVAQPGHYEVQAGGSRRTASLTEREIREGASATLEPLRAADASP